MRNYGPVPPSDYVVPKPPPDAMKVMEAIRKREEAERGPEMTTWEKIWQGLDDIRYNLGLPRLWGHEDAEGGPTLQEEIKSRKALEGLE